MTVKELIEKLQDLCPLAVDRESVVYVRDHVSGFEELKEVNTMKLVSRVDIKGIFLS